MKVGQISSVKSLACILAKSLKKGNEGCCTSQLSLQLKKNWKTWSLFAADIKVASAEKCANNNTFIVNLPYLSAEITTTCYREKMPPLSQRYNWLVVSQLSNYCHSFHRFTHYFVATDVYALFMKSIKKICSAMFKTKGWVNGCLNNVQKNCGFGDGGHPLHWFQT